MSTDIPSLEVSTDGAVKVVALKGEIDISNVSALQSPLNEELASSAGPAVLDLSDTAYLDSAGVRLLLIAVSSAGGRGAGVAVACPPGGRVRRVIEVSGLGEVAPIYDDVSAAAGALTTTGPSPV